MKKIINKKVSVVDKSFNTKVRTAFDDRERRMKDIEGRIIHSGVIDQLKKVRANSTNSNAPTK
ncbi:MAG TPA: hypothetical protein VM802_19210 [Chitinophaga sp.]|uniref:hypothetical protein n=1 Tax=Chitinophaga sp. TaxID=1869181 RepID=UPI002D1C5952|nr:hypothetical protein [Chitinophaga sp.]HVI47015.1 hypothetical protein [Chitinophaga sp.]